jgi:hypothetical protein
MKKIKFNFYFYLILNKVLKIFSYFFVVLFILNLYNLIFGSPILCDSINEINYIHEDSNDIPNESNPKDENSKVLPIYSAKNETFTNKTKKWLY